MLKNRKLQYLEKGATRFIRIFQKILHPISQFLACFIAMDQACRWVIKDISCLLGNAVPNDDIIVTSVKMLFTEEDDKQWRRRLSACVHCAGWR